MAKKNQVYIDVVIDDKGTTKRVAVNAKKLGLELERAGAASDKAAKGSDKLGKSNKDLDRNLRGSADMTSNSTKQFSKMSQGMGGLVGVYATLAAQVFAVTAAFQFLQGASDFRNLIAGQEALGAVSGTAYKTITNSIIEATDAQIKYADAARAAAIGSAAGLTSGQLTELGTVAKNASFALGRDLTDSFNRLVRGVTKAEPELLDELGIILRLETATEKYAEKIGESVGNLTAFQRSQAVANEVLEQGERKFAAIEAMMDPNAAALQQFAKSFDDLFNSFKVGVIEGLTPVLQFLTKNTLALTASLALFAIPIIKAIIPNLDEWRKNSKELYKEHQKDSEKYLKRTQDQSAILKTLTNDQDELDKATRKTAQAQGKATDKGGVGYVSGGTDTGQARAAARKGLKQAEDDLRKHGQVRSGIFKGFTAREVAIARASYNQRAMLSEKHTAVIKRHIDSIGVRAKIVFNSMQAKFSGAMAGMTKIAAASARAINIAMSLAGLIGIITMLGAGVKALYDFFFPLSEAAQREAEKIDELTNKYKDLGAEMERARNARETLTTGSMNATNIGQVLQSADVAGTIKDINELAGMTDKSSDEFLKLKGRLVTITGELAKIDPKFQSLSDSVSNSTVVGEEQAKVAQRQADKLMGIGAAISGLPETIGAADKAFTKLYTSMLKTSPLDEFLNAEKVVQKALNLDIEAAEASRLASENKIKAAEEANEKQEEADKKMYANLSAFMKKRYDDEFAEMDKLEKKRFRAQARTGVNRRAKPGKAIGVTIEGTMTEAEIKAETKRMEQSAKDAEEQNKFLAERQARETVIAELKTKQLQDAQDLTIAQIEATENQVRGVTIEGKLSNLQLQRVSNQQKLLKVQQAQERAQAAFDTKKKDDKGEAQEALDIANRNLRLAKAQFDVAEDKVEAKREELNLEKQLLGLKIQELNLSAQDKAIQREINFEKATGGGTFSSQKKLAGLNQLELQNDLDAAVVRAEAAATKFNKVYNDKLTELTDAAYLEMGGQGPLRPGQQGEIEQNALNQARAQTGDAALSSAQDVVLAADALEINKQKFSTFMKEGVARKENLDFQISGLSLLKSEEEVGRRILQLRKDQVFVTDDQISAIRDQVQEEEDLERKLANMQGLRDNIEQGMAGAFESMITGAKSAKEAYADMAKSMLMYLAKIIAQELALKAIRTAASFFGLGFADGGISAAYGTVTPKKQYAGGGYTSPMRNYSRGGTARGPQQGYNAVLHGNEAVVPLPDNRHIPVEMTGGMGTQNNVTVNVNMDGEGGSQTSTQSNAPAAERMGQLIAKAVQDELQNQKRSGGILSPYGAA